MKTYLLRLFAFVLIGLASPSLWAQVTTSAVSGTITDQSSKESLIGATVLAKHLPQLDQAIALEVSSQAIPIAQENFRQLYEQSGREVYLWHEDLFTLVEAHTPPPTPLDLIVSNPPYIHPSEAEDMTAHVLLYEPHLALFAPEESPLAYYTAIGQLVRQGYLRPGGSLWLELNPLYAEQTRTALLHIIGSEQAETELIKDMSGKNRFLHLTYHSA